jgi:16S rRNA (guanine1207-N2)-methyltransferase
MEGRHYFTDNSDLPERFHSLSFSFHNRLWSFTSAAGVFSRAAVDEGTRLLLETVCSGTLNGRILDLGCGYGVIAIVIKSLFSETEVTAVDVNPRAVELTRRNARAAGVELECRAQDGIGAGGSYDVIVTNPPIRTGKQTVYRLFAQSYAALADGGRFYAVVRRAQGAESALKELVRLFGNGRTVERKKGYWILQCEKS